MVEQKYISKLFFADLTVVASIAMTLVVLLLVSPLTVSFSCVFSPLGL